MQENKRQWLTWWQRVSAQGDSEKVYDDIVARYGEPHRAYHTLAHIKHCLGEFNQVRRLIENPDEVEMGLWFHDVIYDTKAKDNEEKSAELVLQVASNILLPSSFGERVAKLILATKHSESPTNHDVQFLVDIDLSILGQSEAVFNEYERQIRQEYSWIPEQTFIAGRASILKSFIDRPKIYSTRFFQEKYEEQARKNIARSLKHLSELS